MQLYIIRIKFGERYVTAVYAYLQRKNHNAYEELFRIINVECQNRNFNMHLQHVVVGFEVAVLNSIDRILGNHVTKQGCLYHLTQSTWRHIQSLGLTAEYLNQEDFRIYVGKIDGLAFLPVNDVALGMAYLRHNIYPHPQTITLLEYFDQHYVNGTWQNAAGIGNLHRQPPRFPPQLWNVHQATLNDDPRTNNVCESWDNAYFHMIGHHHPSMWKSIDTLKKENA